MEKINKEEAELKQQLTPSQWEKAKVMIEYFKSLRIAVPYGIIQEEVTKIDVQLN